MKYVQYETRCYSRFLLLTIHPTGQGYHLGHCSKLGGHGFKNEEVAMVVREWLRKKGPVSMAKEFLNSYQRGTNSSMDYKEGQ